MVVVGSMALRGFGPHSTERGYVHSPDQNHDDPMPGVLLANGLLRQCRGFIPGYWKMGNINHEPAH